MTILLTSYYYKPHFGGIENSLFSLAMVFKKQGHKVIIFTSDADKRKNGRLAAEEVLDGVLVSRFRRFIPWVFFLSWIGFFVDFVRVKKRLRAIHAANEIDLILSRHYRLIPSIVEVLPAVSHLYILPGVALFQQRVENSADQPVSLKARVLKFYSNVITLPIKHYFQKISIARSVCVVFSERVRRQILDAFPEYDRQIVKMKPGVDVDRFRPHTGGKSTDAFTFLIVGRIIHHKRIDIAIRAFKRVLAQRGRLLVVGTGPKKNELIKLAEREGLGERITFLDYTTHPEKYFGESHAFLMTSTHESFGQTILEAFSCGLPVIGFFSRDGLVETATSELVTDGVNGFLCEFSDELLAKKMEACMNLEVAKYNEMAARNRTLVLQQYRWELLADELIRYGGSVKA